MATLTELDGRLRLDFAEAEVTLLRDLLGRVGDLLADTDTDTGTGTGSDTDTDAERRTPADPVLARLLPDAHREDRDVAAAYRDLTEAGLREDKQADVGAVLAALPAEAGSAVLDDPDAWLRAVNDIRLMMGVELDITEDTDVPQRVSDQRDFELAVYFWLTHLQDSLVEAVLS